jgi:hypothetical protein
VFYNIIITLGVNICDVYMLHICTTHMAKPGHMLHNIMINGGVY